MKKNILFMMTLLLSTLWAQAARDWNPPSGNQYPSHAVVYATLFDASGQEVDNVADMRVGAFIDGEYRAAANPVFRETPDGGRYIYTLRIGVNDADKGKKVSFRLYDALTGEYFVLDDAVDFASTVGTYQRPMALNTPTLTGIDSVTGDQGVAVYLDGGRVVVAGVAAESVEVYNASGMRVAAEGLGTGVYVVRVKTASGTITRTLFRR